MKGGGVGNAVFGCKGGRFISVDDATWFRNVRGRLAPLGERVMGGIGQAVKRRALVRSPIGFWPRATIASSRCFIPSSLSNWNTRVIKRRIEAVSYTV